MKLQTNQELFHAELQYYLGCSKKMGIPKLKGPFLGVPVIRVPIFWGRYGVPFDRPRQVVNSKKNLNQHLIRALHMRLEGLTNDPANLHLHSVQKDPATLHTTFTITLHYISIYYITPGILETQTNTFNVKIGKEHLQKPKHQMDVTGKRHLAEKARSNTWTLDWGIV